MLIVYLADRQAERMGWWGNRVQKTLAGGCAIQENLNFQASAQVSLLCFIAVGLICSFLFLFNLVSPTNTNREGCFHLVWKIHRSQRVWLCQLGGRGCWYPHSCKSAGPVSYAQPSSVALRLHRVLWCGLCCAGPSSQKHLCVFRTCLHTSQSNAMLCQAPANWRSAKFPVDSSDKILLLQTGSTREDWAGGLKPHFCSISFGNPISQLTNRLCSLLVPGMWRYPYTDTSSILAASVLLPHLALLDVRKKQLDHSSF